MAIQFSSQPAQFSGKIFFLANTDIVKYLKKDHAIAGVTEGAPSGDIENWDFYKYRLRNTPAPPVKRLKQVHVTSISFKAKAVFRLLFLLRMQAQLNCLKNGRRSSRAHWRHEQRIQESFPYRVHGAYFGSLQRDHHKITDIVIWNPLTQFQIDLVCHSCEEPRTLLQSVRWKDEQTYYKQPRMLFCIQRQVILVRRVYRYSNDHHVLTHDAGILELVANIIEVPFVLIYQHGLTRDLFPYVMSHIHASSSSPVLIKHPGRKVITNCFLRCYSELEHMYSQHMSELPCLWLSADHTFKVSANIGAWSQGVWVKQFDSLFTGLNEMDKL